MSITQRGQPLPQRTDRETDPSTPDLYYGTGAGALSETEAHRDSTATIAQTRDHPRATAIRDHDDPSAGMSSTKLADRWTSVHEKFRRLGKLHRRQAPSEHAIGDSRSTELERSHRHQVVEILGDQLELPWNVVSRAQSLLMDIDNPSRIGGPAASAIETIALTALAVAHRELFHSDRNDEYPWAERRYIPFYPDESRHDQARLITETDAFDELIDAIDETLKSSVDRDTIRSVYESVFADAHPSPFPSDL